MKSQKTEKDREEKEEKIVLKNVIIFDKMDVVERCKKTGMGDKSEETQEQLRNAIRQKKEDSFSCVWCRRWIHRKRRSEKKRKGKKREGEMRISTLTGVKSIAGTEG